MTLFSQPALLRLCVAVAGLVPVTAGLWGIFGPHLGSSAVGNHDRYLSGLLLAIGLVFWSTLGNIEHKSQTFRLLTLLVVVGGLARVVGIFIGDGLSWPIFVPLVMELLVTPALCVWQGRVATVSEHYLR